MNKVIQKMKIVDLTSPIQEGMWVYDLPISAPRIEQISSIDGPKHWDAHRITLTTLTGTYLEAPAHLIAGAETIDRVDPARFIRPATILQLPDCPPRYMIRSSDLDACGARPKRGDAVLVATGWDRNWSSPDYVRESPFFSPEAMDWLVSSGASIIGGDIPTFDDARNPADVNYQLFKAGCLLLAPMINLRKIPNWQKTTLIALPLPIRGVSATPCRALVIDKNIWS